MLKLERRRSSIEVISDILRLGEAGKTEIMHIANVSFSQLHKYLSLLLELELVHKRTIDNGSVRYRVTPKGLSLLNNIDSMLELLEHKESIE